MIGIEEFKYYNELHYPSLDIYVFEIQTSWCYLIGEVHEGEP